MATKILVAISKYRETVRQYLTVKKKKKTMKLCWLYSCHWGSSSGCFLCHDADSVETNLPYKQTPWAGDMS